MNHWGRYLVTAGLATVLGLFAAAPGNAQMYGRVLGTQYSYAPLGYWSTNTSPYYSVQAYDLNGNPPRDYASWAQGNLPTYMTSINYPTIYGQYGYEFAPGRFIYGAGQPSYNVGPTLFSVYASPNPSLMTTMYTPDVASAPVATTASVSVRLPVADAELNFEGVRTTQTGRVRNYTTPPLVPGNNYTYDISASWTENGRELTRTRHVGLRPGDRVVVDFTTPQAEEATSRILRTGPAPAPAPLPPGRQ